MSPTIPPFSQVLALLDFCNPFCMAPPSAWGEIKRVDDVKAVPGDLARPLIKRKPSKEALDDLKQSVHNMEEGSEKEKALKRFDAQKQGLEEMRQIAGSTSALKRGLSNDLLTRQNWGLLKKMDKNTLVRRVKEASEQATEVSNGYGLTTSDNFVDEKHVHVSVNKMAFDAAVEAERKSRVPFAIEWLPYFIMVSVCLLIPHSSPQGPKIVPATPKLREHNNTVGGHGDASTAS